MSAGYTTFGTAAINSRITVLEENQLYHTKVSLSSAQILTLNSTPVQIIAAQGAGTTIQFVAVLARMNFVTAAYATNTTFQLIFAGASLNCVTNTALLISTATRTGYLPPTTLAGATNSQYYPANADLNATIATGNPTAGGGSIDLYIIYRVLTF